MLASFEQAFRLQQRDTNTKESKDTVLESDNFPLRRPPLLFHKFVITCFYLPLLSTNVKHQKFGCHVTSLCQGLRRSAGSGGEDPENQVVPTSLSKLGGYRTPNTPSAPHPYLSLTLVVIVFKKHIICDPFYHIYIKHCDVFVGYLSKLF